MRSGTIVVLYSDLGVIIVGRGELDLSNAEELKLALQDASKTAENLTVDIRIAEFIDTAILEYLARAATDMLRRGKRLQVLVSAGSHPLYVLKTVGFLELMDIVEDDKINDEI